MWFSFVYSCVPFFDLSFFFFLIFSVAVLMVLCFFL